MDTETIGLFVAICGVIFCLYRLLIEAIAAGIVKGNQMMDDLEDDFWHKDGDDDED